MDFRYRQPIPYSESATVYLKWMFVVLYCVMVVSLANMRSCTDETVLHVGAFNYAETISE